MMLILYRIFILGLKIGVQLGSLFSNKLRKGVEGRAQSLETIKTLSSGKVLWMHAASLGEYLQGLPVLQSLEKEFPDDHILISFFSPSGYENALKKAPKHYTLIYLPLDEPATWEEVLSVVHVRMFVLIKYDFWFHLLDALREKGIPVYVVSAYFYENQYFFKFFGKPFARKLAKDVSWFFHQNAASAALAKSIGLRNGSVSGDTRFDMVRETAKTAYENPTIQQFKGNKRLIIFGSSWEQEEKIAEILLLQNLDIKILIAPHDVERAAHLEKTFPSAIRYSAYKENQAPTDANIMLMDEIGHLSRLYRYGDLAIIGGGFHSKGLHNILEAAVYGAPVIFGEHYKKNPEADDLITAGGAVAFPDEYYAAKFILEILKSPEKLAEMGENAKNFVLKQPNATATVLAKIRSDFAGQS